MAREILIADGNKAAHKAIEEIFKETDYNLIFSENGEDALLKMKLSKPALVIADVTMPDKNGKELCEMLKGDPNLNKIPFNKLGTLYLFNRDHCAHAPCIRFFRITDHLIIQLNLIQRHMKQILRC